MGSQCSPPSGKKPRESWWLWKAKPICLRLLAHLARLAASRTFCTAGSSKPSETASPRGASHWITFQKGEGSRRPPPCSGSAAKQTYVRPYSLRIVNRIPEMVAIMARVQRECKIKSTSNQDFPIRSPRREWFQTTRRHFVHKG